MSKFASSSQRAVVCLFFLASLCAATDLTGVISDNTGTAIRQSWRTAHPFSGTI